MPELPEVETTRRGLEPHILNKKIVKVTVRQAKLRWPVPKELNQQLLQQSFTRLRRRGKYLLFETEQGVMLGHLGMSGSMRMVDKTITVGKHDHFDVEFEDGMILRYTDPRRFGAILWYPGFNIEEHELIAHLGPEPLSDDFNVDYLQQKSVGKKVPVKQFVMDGRVVVGVGNIYANEALFNAGIHPKRAAGKVSKPRYDILVQEIKTVLANAIQQGGTTLRDFVGGDGKPGYFKQSLNVYGRGGEPCVQCGELLKEISLGQRSTVYCKHCQR